MVLDIGQMKSRDIHKLERLGRYKVHLDRKLEQVLRVHTAAHQGNASGHGGGLNNPAQALARSRQHATHQPGGFLRPIGRDMYTAANFCACEMEKCIAV